MTGYSLHLFYLTDTHTILTMAAKAGKPVLKLKDMEEKHLHNLFLKNMSGLIEEVKNPTPRLNPLVYSLMINNLFNYP